MIRAYRFKMYPNVAQTTLLEETIETHRRLYNDGLAERNALWESEKRHVSMPEQSKALTQRRKDDHYLSRVGSDSSIQTLRRLDKSFKAFFRRDHEDQGLPKFCKRGDFKTVDYRWGDGAKLVGNKSYFIHIGEIKTKVYRPLEGKPRTISFSKDAAGWWVIVTCETPDVAPPPHPGPEVGIDLGVKELVTVSDGTVIHNPAYFRQGAERLAEVQRAFFQKKKGSYRRKALRQQWAKHQLHVANQRKEHHRVVAKQLAETYGAIAHEDLAIKDMAQKGHGRSIHDAGWGKLLSALESKSRVTGTVLHAVNPAYTSQTCSQCGHQLSMPLTLEQRTFSCPQCGHSEDRDVNAAKNIKIRATDEGWVQSGAAR